ncbi:MAG: glucosamine-6-phosphate deaminase [Defluviitaleaceae bacterium]|nr:glucosamine-6-phosphate deaminase [Defluviitaleaceae bacterium]
MKIYKAKDYEHLSQIAANILAAQVTLKPDSVLGLSTGQTPIGTYKKLVEKYKSGDLCFNKVVGINLDEYYGLGADNPQSYAYFMNNNLFNHVNINTENVHIPNGLSQDIFAECTRYDEVIAKNPIDIQLLGIGSNGHIGFNEPDAELKLNTHYITLAKATIDTNKRYFKNEYEVPKMAYTMGIKQIMHAKKILLLASGESKAEILRKAFKGSLTTNVPASLLQMHRNLIIVGDEAALKGVF